MITLKRDEILHMLPGRQTDFLVLRDVMNWIPACFPPETGSLDYWVDTNGEQRPCGFSPSTDISAAWEMEEKLYHIGQRENVVMQRLYVAYLAEVVVFDNGFTKTSMEIHATPHQRCRAALLALLKEG